MASPGRGGGGLSTPPVSRFRAAGIMNDPDVLMEDRAVAGREGEQRERSSQPEEGEK